MHFFAVIPHKRIIILPTPMMVFTTLYMNSNPKIHCGKAVFIFVLYIVGSLFVYVL